MRSNSYTIHILLHCERSGCAAMRKSLGVVVQQGFGLAAFLDVSSLNLAAPQGAAFFLLWGEKLYRFGAERFDEHSQASSERREIG